MIKILSFNPDYLSYQTIQLAPMMWFSDAKIVNNLVSYTYSLWLSILFFLYFIYSISNLLLSGGFKLTQLSSKVQANTEYTTSIAQSLCNVYKYPRCYSTCQYQCYKRYNNSTNHHSSSGTILYPILSILFHFPSILVNRISIQYHPR